MKKTTEKPPAMFQSGGRQFVEMHHETSFTLAQERIARKEFSTLLSGAQNMTLGDADEGALLALACVEIDASGAAMHWTPQRYEEWKEHHNNYPAPKDCEGIYERFFDSRTASITRGFRIYSALGAAAQKMT